MIHTKKENGKSHLSLKQQVYTLRYYIMVRFYFLLILAKKITTNIKITMVVTITITIAMVVLKEQEIVRSQIQLQKRVKEQSLKETFSVVDLVFQKTASYLQLADSIKLSILSGIHLVAISTHLIQQRRNGFV